MVSERGDRSLAHSPHSNGSDHRNTQTQRPHWIKPTRSLMSFPGSPTCLAWRDYRRDVPWCSRQLLTNA